MYLAGINKEQVVGDFFSLVRKETLLTADIIEYIKEIDIRRLYLEHECTSLFQFLTEKAGYTSSSAQRRIDAARLLRRLPEIREDLISGDLNIMQLSQMARVVREKEKTSAVSVSEQREILSSIRGCSTQESERIICSKLEIAPTVPEKKRMQSDGSTRVEMTFRADEMALFQRVKDLMSHVEPGATCKEMLVRLAEDYVQRKDPLKQKPVTATVALKAKSRRYISAKLRRQVSQEEQSCRWKDPQTGKICGSTFQAQIDHIHGVAKGGMAVRDNLQLLCSAHNRYKYRIRG